MNLNVISSSSSASSCTAASDLVSGVVDQQQNKQDQLLFFNDIGGSAPVKNNIANHQQHQQSISLIDNHAASAQLNSLLESFEQHSGILNAAFVDSVSNAGSSANTHSTLADCKVLILIINIFI
jgi:hypothetical protein